MTAIGSRRRTVHAVALALCALAAACAAGLAHAGSAQARVWVGIGTQTPDLFASPSFYALKTPRVRYVTPWDTVNDPGQLQRLDAYVAAATTARAHVMIAFRTSLRSRRATLRLPTPSQFQRAFRALRARYPQVRDWVPWNETNHHTALTYRRPDLAAAYFNIVTRYCRGCNVVAADVLDVANMETWLRRYRRHLKYTPKIWGLHNYHDANAMTGKGVRRLLKITRRGKIWMTETGGVVRMRVTVDGRLNIRNYGLRHAAASTKYVLNLARISRRITRIYLYHWQAPRRFTTWDSGLTDARMRPRPAYRSLLAWLLSARRKGLAAR